MRVLAFAAFKIRYSAMILCFNKCITGIFESFHFCCYNGRPIDVNYKNINHKTKTNYKIKN